MRPDSLDQQGFTLVELMAAVLITVIIVAATMTTVVSSNRANVANSQVADAQQNSRLGIEILTHEIKLAGYNYDTTDPATASVGNCKATIGAIEQRAGLLPQDQNPAGADAGPDGVSLVVPVTNGWTLTAMVGSTSGAGLSNQISLSAASISGMQAQGMVVGSTVSLGGAVAKKIQVINPTSIVFATGDNVKGQFPVGTPIYLMQCVRYQVAGNTLQRDGVPLVDGVEDLQIAYACDGCNQAPPNPFGPDGIIDDQDGSSAGGFPSFTQGDFVSNGSWAISPRTSEKIRLVQVSLVVRSAKTEEGVDELGTKAVNTSGPVIVGDHDPSTDSGYDATSYQQQRRRVIVRTVQPRNL